MKKKTKKSEHKTRKQTEEKLNKLFPYKNAKCLIEEEYNYLKEFFSKHKNTLTNIEQQELLKI